MQVRNGSVHGCTLSNEQKKTINVLQEDTNLYRVASGKQCSAILYYTVVGSVGPMNK